MKYVKFVPRAVAEKMIPGESVLISIHDASEDRADVSTKWKDVLYLRFHDADPGTKGLELFSEEMAKQAAAFVKRYKDVDSLVVHCQAGRSRSAGLAIAFSEKLGVPCLKERQEINAASYPFYNRHVYRVMMNTLMAEGNE